ncbi:RNA polymerase sigma factor [Arthrobacter sp. 24S4-2]|uniref:RNA polymerase sigma factor n=1 Tax=Arthrobacter sp. 24S4-2 TaxID=2575374 RepID=UPI001C2F8C37|nr:sigma-70 family RNA polymerase sigma factor [Arthrobacter sp. 24S4-2]
MKATASPPDGASAGTGPAAAEAEARLVQDCREGKTGAVLELFRTHWEPALAYANVLSRSSHDAEDAAATAFLKSLTAMRRGKGPDGPVRPYLLRAVRTAAVDRHSSGEHPSGRIMELADGQNTDGLHSGAQEHDFVAEAFATLPLRWQRVLWYVEIEGLKPREAAPLLDVAPNALSALLRRARKGLRKAYLLVYLRDSEIRGCDSMLQVLAESVLARTTVAGQARVDGHIRTCRNCRGALQGLRDVRSRMQSLLNPGLLPAVLSPLTAVRILETLSSPSHCPLGHLAETINESADFVRTLFHGLKTIGVSAAVVVLMVLPAAPNAATPEQEPPGRIGGCGPYGTSVGCVYRSATAPDYLQLRAGTRSSQ